MAGPVRGLEEVLLAQDLEVLVSRKGTLAQVSALLLGYV